MPGSGLKLPLKHLNGHKTLGNPYFAGKLTVLQALKYRSVKDIVRPIREIV